MQKDFETLLKTCDEPLQTPYHKSLRLYAKIWKRVGDDGKSKILRAAESVLKPVADNATPHKTYDALCTYISESKINLYLSVSPVKKDAPKFSISLFANKAIREGKQESFGKAILDVLSHLNPALKVATPMSIIVEEEKDAPDTSTLIQRIVENLDPNNPDAALSMIDDLGDPDMSNNLRATLEEIKGLKGSDKAVAKKKIKELVSTLVAGVVDNYM